MTRARALIGCLAAAFLVQAARAAGEPPLVLTGTQATYSLTVALTAGTPIQVQNVPIDGRQLGLLKDYIERRAEALAPTFAKATAVDAPSSNVEWGGDEAESAVAPYFWLSLSNAIRMGDIIARDLEALFPDSAETIGANLEKLKRSLLDLRGEYQHRLIESGADVVFALTGDFVYLTNDMGLFVDGYFIKQDVRWTESDLAMLTQHLRDREIKIVLHEWEPSDAIQDAVRAAGAKLVVLDAGDPGVVVDRELAPDGLQQILRKNLDAIVGASGE
jgi:ABC-type Zn uptake system ZnuABC Zn-binding protein ZnuA